jgi:hypothetical protein
LDLFISFIPLYGIGVFIGMNKFYPVSVTPWWLGCFRPETRHYKPETSPVRL